MMFPGYMSRDLKESEPWRKKIYYMWVRMHIRVKDVEDIRYECYKDVLIWEGFSLFSNFLKWIESQPRFEEFKSTCHEVSWSIDKDILDSTNRNYFPECMSLTTKSENSSDAAKRQVRSSKPIIGIPIDNNSPIIIFNAVSDARSHGFYNIGRSIKNNKYSSKGYKWYYLNIIKL